ncbi:MAG TPA: nuclear transport factor 2 family protein [Gemmatimonadaceae bacterium]|nr:nuclear transport factor 2 family protein [Gemmatimonadaceae bacterium]
MSAARYKPLRGVSLLVLATSVLLVGFGPRSTASTSSQSGEIELMMQKFLAAFSNRDVEAFTAYFAEDASMFFPPSAFSPPASLVEGRTNIAAAFRGLYERTGPRRTPANPIQPQDMRVKTFDGSAVVTFHLGSDSVRGRRTFVLRRTGAEWTIVHLHSSTLESQRAR